jgi:hypothetical protein
MMIGLEEKKKDTMKVRKTIYAKKTFTLYLPQVEFVRVMTIRLGLQWMSWGEPTCINDQNKFCYQQPNQPNQKKVKLESSPLTIPP